MLRKYLVDKMLCLQTVDYSFYSRLITMEVKLCIDRFIFLCVYLVTGCNVAEKSQSNYNVYN